MKFTKYTPKMQGFKLINLSPTIFCYNFESIQEINVTHLLILFNRVYPASFELIYNKFLIKYS